MVIIQDVQELFINGFQQKTSKFLKLVQLLLRKCHGNAKFWLTTKYVHMLMNIQIRVTYFNFSLK